MLPRRLILLDVHLNHLVTVRPCSPETHSVPQGAQCHLNSAVKLHLTDPGAPVHIVPAQERLRLLISEILGPAHSPCSVGPRSIALVLSIEHRPVGKQPHQQTCPSTYLSSPQKDAVNLERRHLLLSRGVTPVEPAVGVDGGFDIGVHEDDLGVSSPGAAQVDGPVPCNDASIEDKSTGLVLGRFLLRCQ